MWLLRNEEKGLVFRISPGKQNVVSRKDGDLLLQGDQSISRKHAELVVHNENQNGGIVLKDLGSKYGTFTATDGEELTQVSPNDPITLKNGDAIRFGIQWNLWRVEYFPLVVVTSTLNAAEKTEVKEVLAALGGELVNDWQPCCTHLTMNKLTVTVKVVCALASGKPIVLPGYWKALKDALSSMQTTLPDCKDFVPPLAEALLNPAEVSFTPNPERSKLFSGYTFVAASPKQLNRIKPMITAAGGTAVEFCASLWPHSKLMKDRVVLMQHTASDKQGSQQSQVPDGYLAAARKLKAAGVRCVPESEVGLSVLYCSMAQFCNPRHSPQSLFGSSSSQNTQQITVVCPSTEESVSNGKKQEQSKGNQPKPSCSKKRPLDDSSEDERHPSKKTNSEDMFSSPTKDLPDRKSNPLSLKKSGPKQSIVDRSLDMFAPSGQTSGQNVQNNKAQTNNIEASQKQKPSIVNPSLDMFAPSVHSTSSISQTNKMEPSQKKPPSNVNPSLDMFAPSGQTSNRENRIEMAPSCQDIFASNQSRQPLGNKRQNQDESNHVSSKEPRISLVHEEDDDFSFTTNKKTSKPQNVAEKERDAFSFSPAQKRNGRQVIDYNDVDEFSFVSNKKKNHQNVDDKDDDFSFVSSKNPKKRNRQNDPDMLDSRAGPSTSKDKTNVSVRMNRNIALNENENENDDLFAFAGGPAPKKKKNNNEKNLNVDEPDAEVNLALFNKTASNKPPNNLSEPTIVDDPPDEKNLKTYGKDKPCPKPIKEEVEEEEIDELARELQNATIVVVKPLVVPRQKPAEAQVTSSGKNFKKFRKVTGMNKRTIPHIIGGSDLVPHYANCHNIDDVLPPSPPNLAPDDDDWGFPKEKTRGKTR